MKIATKLTKIEKYAPILHLKSIVYFHKNQIKLGQLGERTAKSGYPYALFCQKHFSKSKSNWLNSAHGKNNSVALKKLNHTANLLTSAFKSKLRLNE